MNSPPSIPHEDTSSAFMPKNSGLAICSLVFALIGLITVGIFSIPAVIIGHLALRRIKVSAGTLSGRGLAMAGLIIGYLGIVFIPILVAVGFAAGKAATGKVRDLKTRSAAIALDASIEQFHIEYSALPSAVETTDTALDASLVRTLTAVDKTLNVRGLRFLALPESVSKKGGLDPVTHKLYDPWGNGYMVIIDVHSSGSIIVTRGGITETVSGRKAVVYSLGADGIAGTVDDVTTW